MLLNAPNWFDSTMSACLKIVCNLAFDRAKIDYFTFAFNPKTDANRNAIMQVQDQRTIAQNKMRIEIYTKQNRIFVYGRRCEMWLQVTPLLVAYCRQNFDVVWYTIAPVFLHIQCPNIKHQFLLTFDVWIVYRARAKDETNKNERNWEQICYLNLYTVIVARTNQLKRPTERTKNWNERKYRQVNVRNINQHRKATRSRNPFTKSDIWIFDSPTRNVISAWMPHDSYTRKITTYSREKKYLRQTNSSKFWLSTTTTATKFSIAICSIRPPSLRPPRYWRHALHP